MEKLKNVNVKSFAKINLYLDTLNKRDDDFTEIRTVFSEIDLYDTINFALTKNGDIKILTDIIELSTEKNLIYKVAIFLQNTYEVKFGVEIELIKNIPIAAGLGGGSSNAAYTILALNELWDLKISEEEMHDIAAKFGSDINFFLRGGAATGFGRGEIIKPVEIEPIEHVLLVNPGFPISSGEAYGAVLKYQKTKNWDLLLESGDPKYCFNALEDGVCRSFPEIQNILNELNGFNAMKSMLSGSGATVIGFFPDFSSTKQAEEFFKKKGYWTYITKTKKG
jgi:4-diphosphocytidyl-2-C-methyl-D-erythritol kinase